MEVLTIANSVFNLGIAIFLIKKYNPFYISVNRTFWMKKIYSFTLMRINHKNEYGSSASGIFTVGVRNYEKAEKWDSEQFRNRNYKKLTTPNKQ